MDFHLLVIGTLPARHFGQGVIISTFVGFKLGILRWFVSNRLGDSILRY
jgi:hypothetical protein